MTDLAPLLAPDTVLEGLVVANKRLLLSALSGVAGRAVGAAPKVIGDLLSARERLGSTGFGGGVAIPHARLAGLSQPTGVFARLAHPVDYDAVDDGPVDLVFLLLSPTGAGATHLKALAGVSRRLRDRTLLAKLRGAGSRDALYALLTSDEARDAA